MDATTLLMDLAAFAGIVAVVITLIRGREKRIRWEAALEARVENLEKDHD